ncbi:MAG: ATP-binding protein [Propionibacteriaceae bacterium]|jgi:predicted AAA+ superfamily ATPase|nr:ATP-binding protein [Propionibacteriaceae bacterium]
MAEYIPRETELASLRRWRDKDMVKVVTGVRRCGKSTLLALFAEELRQQGVPDERIVTLNLEDFALSHLLKDPRAFHDHVASLLRPGERTYLFIDEIQLLDAFETALNSLALNHDLDVYVTGSNAQMLSSEIATRLAGRYVEIHLLPLSYAQYAAHRRLIADPEEDLSYPGLYASFVSQGGFPLVQRLAGDPEAVSDYLRGIIDTVLIKDVAIRAKVANVALLTDVTTFLLHNVGNLTSLRRIADTLGTFGRKPSSTTVDSYVSGLVDAFLVYPVRRWDIQGLRLLAGPDKYYAVDPGVRNALVGYAGGDAGHLLENVVYLELRRRHTSVWCGASKAGEIDFVVSEGADLTFYQVAQTVRPPDTLARELAPLQAIRDHHPKRLLTLDAEPPITHDGIQQLYVLDWLRGAGT